MGSEMCIRDRYINLTGYTFDDFINRRIEVVKDFYPTIDDWELHLTTIFPEARLKKFIEMRGADAGNINHVCALSAFWVGLMYDDHSLSAAIELTKNISSEELVELRNIVPSKGLNSKLDKLDLYQLASEVISISKDGLKRRNNLNKDNLDESYLNYNNLHFIVLDGPVQHMNDQRLKKIRKKTQIYYVGKFDNYWRNIENASLLYPDNPSDQEKILLSFNPLFQKCQSLKVWLSMQLTLLILRDLTTDLHHSPINGLNGGQGLELPNILFWEQKPKRCLMENHLQASKT